MSNIVSKKIFIDGQFSEEIRVAVCKDGILDEFHCQRDHKKASKGNIYLGKVDRIEPSIQAAFIDYGGDRHGFLPFTAIDPKCYSLEDKDKEILMQLVDSIRGSNSEQKLAVEDDAESEEPKQERLSSESTLAEEMQKRYKIQNILKKGQSLLVQVVKEGKGSKGVTLTTYIGLVGQYCTFLPTTSKAGGVSRAISDPEEKKRMAICAASLEQREEGSSVVIRATALHKTKAEVKRDFSYLDSVWKSLKKYIETAIAPAFIYEEHDIIARTLRDSYDSEVEEIIVSGENAFSKAHKLMSGIMPRHLDKVKKYDQATPIFHQFFNIEEQIGALHKSQVKLSSGAYLVINHTEALVAIDINSGKLKGGSGIEATALRSNLEAAEEIARQLVLRDLSGVIVVDFIDMIESENRKSVENSIRTLLSKDKAHTQVSSIGEFGLLQITRQRRGEGAIDASSATCSTCEGKGRVRLIAATAFAVLRSTYAEIVPFIGKTKGCCIEISGANHLIGYLANNVRKELAKIECEHEITIQLYVDEAAGYDGFFIEFKKHTASQKNEALYNVEEVSMQNSSTYPVKPKASEQELNKNFGNKFKNTERRKKHKKKENWKPEEETPKPVSLLRTIWRKIIE